MADRRGSLRSNRLPLAHLAQTAGEPPPVGRGKRARI